MKPKTIYLALCVAGTLLPYSQFVPFLREHGLDLRLFVEQLFSNRIGGFFGLDVIVSSVVLWAFVIVDGRRARMKHLWAPIAANLAVGVSLGLPLFLYMREELMERSGRLEGNQIREVSSDRAHHGYPKRNERFQMTKLRLALFVVPVLVMLVSAADVSGVWDMSFKADWTSIPDLVCTFSQKGQELTGSCKAAGERNGKMVDLTGGKVDGDRVSCQWNVVTPDGETWTYALTGTLDANGTMMKGAFKLSSRFSGGEGSFTAKKQ